MPLSARPRICRDCCESCRGLTRTSLTEITRKLRYFGDLFIVGGRGALTFRRDDNEFGFKAARVGRWPSDAVFL